MEKQSSFKMPTKAIICAAGLGTRFLPQTKSMPKEMLPVVDKPVIQLIVEELVNTGVEDIIIVGGMTKRALEDHFDRSYFLEKKLEDAGKQDKANMIRDIAEMANFCYVRQKGEPEGNARPVINASHLLNKDEPFFVLFADDFFRSDIPRSKQLLDVYQQTGKSVISLVKIDRKDADKYGMADVSAGLDNEGKVFEIKQLLEKPGMENTQSDLASVGGYLLTPDIMKYVLEEIPDKRGEITLADSINKLAKDGRVCGCVIDGVWHDTGDQLKYIYAIIDMALHDDRYKQQLANYLASYKMENL